MFAFADAERQVVEHVTFGVHVTIRYVACFDERFGGLIINAFR